jgi:hypothetical protein
VTTPIPGQAQPLQKDRIGKTDDVAGFGINEMWVLVSGGNGGGRHLITATELSNASQICQGGDDLNGFLRNCVRKSMTVMAIIKKFFHGIVLFFTLNNFFVEKFLILVGARVNQ